VAKLREILTLRNPATRRTLLIGLAFIAGLAVLGIAGIQVWEYSNSVDFCAGACHEVHPEEPAAFSDSYHARVKCTECHMGRTGTLQGIFVKAGHFRHLPEVLSGRYDRPTKSETMRPANESCERCHWPPAFHGDTVREIQHFEPDEENTEERTYLILKTGGGERERGLGYGIHWHIENQVEYIASDEEKQDIRWVRTTLPDGRVVEYNDLTNPLTPEEIAESESKVMDCVDCHNRVGHPFPYPERATDDAIADGKLSRDLPFAKKEMLDLLSANYDSQEAALQAVDAVREGYIDTYPEIASANPDAIEQAANTATELIKRLVFEEPGVTWESFPDSGQHKEFAGCFRCHDGKHVTSEGESIRLHCNICHSIPVTVGEGDRPPQMPVVSVEEPASHLEASFMADHRFQANESCEECHGEIAFGDDNSSFCANSACHGQAWPQVELDAGFTHPIELVGKHSEVWCHDCHEGVTKPEYECANCHEPPSKPHFGEQCDDCHTPEGFKPADMGVFEHPVPLEGKHSALDCLACHSTGFDLTFECATCHQPPSQPHFGEQCELCHTPDGFETPDLSAMQHPVLLEGQHATLDCMACHSAGSDLIFECASCHEPPSEPHFGEQCEVCHTPEGFEAPDASSVQHPVPLEGKHATLDCMACHSAGFDLTFDCAFCHEPPSQPHFGKDCAACHTPDGFQTPDLSAFEHPVPLEGQHATLDCLACHSAGFDLAFECASCHEPPSEPHFGEQCELCHTPDGFETPDLSVFEHPVPLEGQHATLDCMACHSAGFDLAFECASCHQPPENHFDAPCQTCHAPEGWAESATSVFGPVPEIPHALEGMDDCLQCHDPDGNLMPAPADHSAYAIEQCTTCHKPAP
jgi:hypothetical protein